MITCLPGQSPIHGMGVIAHNDIAQGQRMLSEAPALEMVSNAAPSASNDKLFDDIQKLDKKDRTALLLLVKKENSAYKSMTIDTFANQLSNPTFEISEAVLKVFFSYSYPFGSERKAAVYRLFKALRFLNHSCDPNAELCWDDKAGQMVLRATKPIAAGWEIVVSYIDQFNERCKRHSNLGFVCGCPVCAFTGETKEKVEAAIVRLGEAFKTLGAFRTQYPACTSDFVKIADEGFVQAVIRDPHRPEVEAAANDIVGLMHQFRMYHSSKAEAYGILYIVYASYAVFYPDTSEGRINYERAFDFKCREFETLTRCLGPLHPKTAAVLSQLEQLAQGQGHEERRRRLGAALTSVGADVEVKQKKDGDVELLIRTQI